MWIKEKGLEPEQEEKFDQKICFICADLPEDPTMISECKHIFCENCIGENTEMQLASGSDVSFTDIFIFSYLQNFRNFAVRDATFHSRARSRSNLKTARNQKSPRHPRRTKRVRTFANSSPRQNSHPGWSKLTEAPPFFCPAQN